MQRFIHRTLFKTQAIIRSIVILAVVITQSSCAQFSRLNKEADLPEKIYETSGLETLDGQVFWTHNDSGHEPELYAINSSGEIIRTLKIRGAQNVDWEDLSFDEEGYLYIADIGNNLNKRRDQVIYKVLPSLDSNEVGVLAKIRINYQDQTEYPPSKSNMRYDAEAITVQRDTIYLFTKNRTEPYDRTFHCYAFPAKEGHYMVLPIDTLELESGSKFKTWITAADHDHETGDLYLLSSDKFWIFRKSHGDDVFTSDHESIRLGSFSQKEGLAIDPAGTIWITDEVFKLIGGNLYSFKAQRD